MNKVRVLIRKSLTYSYHTANALITDPRNLLITQGTAYMGYMFLKAWRMSINKGPKWWLK